MCVVMVWLPLCRPCLRQRLLLKKSLLCVKIEQNVSTKCLKQLKCTLLNKNLVLNFQSYDWCVLRYMGQRKVTNEQARKPSVTKTKITLHLKKLKLESFQIVFCFILFIRFTSTFSGSSSAKEVADVN